MTKAQTYIIILCVFCIMVGIWTIDVSVSAIISNGYMTNGFWIFDPLKQYHIALYITIVFSAILSAEAIHMLYESHRTAPQAEEPFRITAQYKNKSGDTQEVKL